MRVGQIRSVAVKLFQELNSLCAKEREDYKNSIQFSQDLADFIERDQVCRRITEAYNLLLTLPNYIKSITVCKYDEQDSRYNRYNSTETIDRNEDLMKEYNREFDKHVTYNYSYNVPHSTEEMYFLLEYQTITAGNLLEVEEKVKGQLKNPEGFKVILE